MKRFGTISLITLFVCFPLLFPSCEEEKNNTPTADFTIDPYFGTIETTFIFDANLVQDLEDPSEELMVRWDWESDSIFDTDFSTTKIIEHKFSSGGTFYVTLEVKDTKGLTARKTDYVRVAFNNRAPVARIVVTPGSGFLQDIFVFDASTSTDIEDKDADLLVRWDFDGNGDWDTEYSKEKIAEYQFDTAGDYEVKLEVKDSEGLTSTGTYRLVVGGTNTEPEPPQNIAPAPNFASQSTRCLLEWSCVDPDQDELLFDVYFGLPGNLSLIATDIAEFSYLLMPLDFSSSYSWKVVAKDPYNHEVSSEVWNFTTWDPEFEMGRIRDPRDGKFYKTVNINDKLWLAENLNVGTMIIASDGGDDRDGYQKDNNKAEKYCYNNKEENCDLYGGLYQWNEAMGYSETINAEGICPPGWHVPNADEWKALKQYFEENLGVSAGENLQWGSKSGFEMLYSGYLIFAERKFYDGKQAGYAWSSTVNPDISHLSMGRSVFNEKTQFEEDTFQKVSGLPVRCLKNY